jgi:hypothetical protein
MNSGKNEEGEAKKRETENRVDQRDRRVPESDAYANPATRS